MSPLSVTTKDNNNDRPTKSSVADKSFYFKNPESYYVLAFYYRISDGRKLHQGQLHLVYCTRKLDITTKITL
jgi:hypothetical protein